MLGIIDYGSGNFSSVMNAMNLLCSDIVPVRTPNDLEACERLILPGVGAFGAAMKSLESLSLLGALEKAVLKEKKPFLGICVGMQILARKGYEFGENPGLGWIDASVRRFELHDSDLLLPHIGWNNVEDHAEQILFQGINSEEPSFYFVHSYCMEIPLDGDVEVTLCRYEKPFVAAVRKGNIFGVQFHPEKSQKNGLRVLKNFLEYRG
jgi:glutamine amidotransferase